MPFVHSPTLAIQRALYDLPRDMKRFSTYIEKMTGGTGDIALPLTLMNPMAKPHVADELDRLLKMGAEDAAIQAVGEANRRLAWPAPLKVTLVLADDVAGGWTDRDLTEAQARLEPAAMLKRGWSLALFWASESTGKDTIRQEVLASCYRSAHVLRHGVLTTLGTALRQEGRAARFAGIEHPRPDEEARAIIARHRDSRVFGTIFAALYGDEAATRVGHAPLGLSGRAGFSVALAEAHAEARTPESALAT